MEKKIDNFKLEEIEVVETVHKEYFKGIALILRMTALKSKITIKEAEQIIAKVEKISLSTFTEALKKISKK